MGLSAARAGGIGIPPMKTRIIIPLANISTGTTQPRAIHDPLSHSLLSAVGDTTTRRASNVETGKDLSQAALRIVWEYGHATQHHDESEAITGEACPQYKIKPEYREHWFADMTPCGKHVVLGPFDPGKREQALQSEVTWLQDHDIPSPTVDGTTAPVH